MGKSKKVVLNEGFAVRTNVGLIFCDGITICPGYAIVHLEKNNIYSITHIDSGMRINSNKYLTLEEAMQESKNVIAKTRKMLAKNEALRRSTKQAVNIMNRMIKEKKFVKV